MRRMQLPDDASRSSGRSIGRDPDRGPDRNAGHGPATTRRNPDHAGSAFCCWRRYCRHRTPEPAMRLTALPLALALTLATLTPVAGAQDVAAPVLASDATQLTLSVRGEARRVPDIARFSAGVVTEHADANAALRANAVQMQQVMQALAAAGIPARDIQTSGIQLSPQYRYAQNQPPRVTGYQARNGVNVTVRELGHMGKVMDALAASGANQINGPMFDVSDREGALEEARLAAVATAKARAATYARALGLRVRRVISLGENSNDMPMPVPRLRMAVAAAAPEAETPVAAGENVLSVDLAIVFELGR
jgi:uncharacterized protein YggE